MLGGLSTNGLVGPIRAKNRINNLAVYGSTPDSVLGVYGFFNKNFCVNYPKTNTPFMKVRTGVPSYIGTDLFFANSNGQSGGRIFPNGTDTLVIEASNGISSQGRITVTGSSGITLDVIQSSTTFVVASSVMTFSGGYGALYLRYNTDGLEVGAAATETTRIIKARDASGTNTAGNSLIIAGGKSTGTGVGGDLKIQVTPAGSSGSSVNTLSTAVTVSGANGAVTLSTLASTAIPLSINLASAQSANALNITSSGGSAGDLLNIGPAGRINIGGTTASSLGRQLNIHATTPGVVLYETDGGTDAKGWDFVVAAEVFTFRCFNDAINAASNIFTVARSSYTPNHMRIYPALELSSFHYNTYMNNGNSGTAKTVDWSVTQVQRVALTDNCTFTFTAPNGISDVLLHVTQDGTGGYAATWPASVKWAGGVAPTLTTAAGAVSVLRFFYDGASYWGSYELDVK